MKKSFLKSRTFWINVIAATILIAEGATGSEVVIPLELQAGILAGINLILRSVTREPVGW